MEHSVFALGDEEPQVTLDEWVDPAEEVLRDMELQAIGTTTPSMLMSTYIETILSTHHGVKIVRLDVHTFCQQSLSIGAVGASILFNIS